MAAKNNKISISKEDYLKAIAEAETEGEPVIAATVSRWLNVSAPAVTMAIRRLKRDGYIEVDGKGNILLTAEGRRIANRILDRHHLIERMLVEIFDMEWYKVHEEAERLEHAVSEDFERLLVNKLQPGRLCPHGNDVEVTSPARRRQLGWIPLAEASVPALARVMSVYERDRELLEYLDRLNVRPGAELALAERNYDDTITFDVAGRREQLGLTVARRIWVQMVPDRTA